MNRLSPQGQDYTGIDMVELADPLKLNCKIKTAQSYYDTPGKLIADDLSLGLSRYKNQLLTAEQVVALREQLLALIQTQKIHLDAELRIKQVANELAISSHQLSQLINDQFDKNFNEFINEFRVQEAISIMRGDKSHRYHLLDVALASGFNSQAVFNPAFKKVTQLTPSQFKKSLC